jgi:hypothetical protein
MVDTKKDNDGSLFSNLKTNQQEISETNKARGRYGLPPVVGKAKSKAEELYLQEPPGEDELPDWLRERNDDKGAVVYYDWSHFGQIPQELLRDPKIQPTAKALFGLLHTYSQHKNLAKKPTTFVSQDTLAQDMGLHINAIGRLLKHLKEKGWLSVKRRGLTKSNVYILHGRRKGAKK